jgi:hypothetical protein
MPLPTSGPLSLSDIQGEFGGTNPISLSEYYAGGGLVPPGTTGTFGAVPTVGNPISIRNFYGTSAATAVYRLDSDVYSDFGIAGVEPSTGVNFTVRSDGTILVTGDNSGTLANYNWITPTTGSTTYFVRATLTGGSFNSGTIATWLPLTSNRSWVVRVFTIGTRTATADFEIATDSGGTNVVVSGTVTLNAEMI